MNVQDLIVLLIVLAAAAYAVRWMYRSLTGRKGCGCGSKSCTSTSPDSPAARGAKLNLPVVEGDPASRR